MTDDDSTAPVGGLLTRFDELLWHLTNVAVGVAVFYSTLVYAPPGMLSVELGALSVDPFYVLAPLSAGYAVWTGAELLIRYLHSG